MTCSTLSASIAVAVPTKYIRKPGCRRAANETGAGASAPPGSALANQTPGRLERASVTKSPPGREARTALKVARQPGALGRETGERTPVIVRTTGGDE